GDSFKAVITALWAIQLAPLVICPCILLQARAIFSGAPIYPIRQPVIANALETPFTVTVLSYISSNWAMLACSPAKLMCSYISSETTIIWGCFWRTSASALNSSALYTEPLGLQGELYHNIL